MAIAAPFSNQLASNPQALDGLRKLASSADSREGIQAAAKQFESYFLQMMLRTMRETVSEDGLFNSQETRTFTEMFDQQVSQSIAQGRGLGFAEMLVAQIEMQLPQAGGKPVTRPVAYDLPPTARAAETTARAAEIIAETAAPAAEAHAVPATGLGTRLGDRIERAADAAGQFVDKLWPHATQAAQTLGLAPHLLLGQAALESGWGRHVLKGADGSNSHNLFNIKAGAGWSGATVEKSVTEYVNGKPVQSTEKFRAYDSYAEAFADYAKLLSGNPRYAGVLNQDAEGFARGLQQAGYATDPAYADKLQRVIGSAALRSAMAG